VTVTRCREADGGRFTTVSCGRITLRGEGELPALSRLLAEELRDLATAMLGRAPDPTCRILVAGLGNADMTPDAIGPGTVRRMTVTRHLKTYDEALYASLGCCELSAVIPGVLGQTGMESGELVRAAAELTRPDLLVAVDALAARSCERLSSTVQLTDRGISPGAGIGNRRMALTAETVGCPVLGVGVPTVVDSATLVWDTLEQAGLDTSDLPDALAELLARLPFLGGVTGEEVWERAVSALMSFLPAVLKAIAAFLPSVLLSVAVGGIAAVYFCLDLDAVHMGFARLVPQRLRAPLGKAKRHLTAAFLTLLRSNGILMLIAFGLMLPGFSILGLPYPFLLSAVFSLFDLLPVIGVGAFLLPMGAVKLLLGETTTGVGILLLFGLITVVRQLAEPRLLGAQNGVHPLLILFSLYAGAKLFGTVGLLFFPVFTLLLYSLFFSEGDSRTRKKRKRTLSKEPVGK
jgi:predicted PurR-regulated permease PerM